MKTNGCHSEPPGVASHPLPTIVLAVAAVTATYLYFLIFAEFAFLRLAATAAKQAEPPPAVMGLLGVGGIAGSLFAGLRRPVSTYGVRLAVGFAFCAVASMLAALAHPRGWEGLSALIGVALGWTTVTLCAGLRSLCGPERLGRCIGLGTGFAYAICNLPLVFEANPSIQAWIATAAAGAGAIAALRLKPSDELTAMTANGARSGENARWILILAALVWLDSAAFYIIQNTPALRAETWRGLWTLYGNATTHLVGAGVAGWALDLRKTRSTVLVSFLLLGGACALLSRPIGARLGGAEVFYTLGVSGYSVALVFLGAHRGDPKFAGHLFALSGWLGSAVGILAAQGRDSLPPWFVAGSTVVVLGALVWQKRGALRVTPAPLVLLGALLANPPDIAQAQVDAVGLGREIYIREGCIHCHSQFIRPHTSDTLLWGPARSLGELLVGAPPLPGNRRQGPDLTNVGNRRSPDWNRLHLIEPKSITPGSHMPGYAHLFRQSIAADLTAGNALVSYLASLGLNTIPARQTDIQRWTPAPGKPSSPERARRLFDLLCATCHGADAHGDGVLADQLGVRPPDFARDPWRRTRGDETEIARIIKFGLPGSPMAGREYLADPDVQALAKRVIALHAASSHLSEPSQSGAR